jgi:hypothetical protein
MAVPPPPTPTATQAWQVSRVGRAVGRLTRAHDTSWWAPSAVLLYAAPVHLTCCCCWLAVHAPVPRVHVDPLAAHHTTT